jgi:formate hydrogenlyase subunit 4
MLSLILLIFAFLLSLIEAFQPWMRPFPRPHLGWLALSVYFLSLILTTAGLH